MPIILRYVRGIVSNELILNLVFLQETEDGHPDAEHGRTRETRGRPRLPAETLLGHRPDDTPCAEVPHTHTHTHTHTHREKEGRVSTSSYSTEMKSWRCSSYIYLCFIYRSITCLCLLCTSSELRVSAPRSLLCSAVNSGRSSPSAARQRSRSSTVRSEEARPSSAGPPCRGRGW